MLVVHLLWTDDDGGGFLLWGEDSNLDPSGPPKRARNPVPPPPRPHPFAASGPALTEAVLQAAPVLHAAVTSEKEETAVVWLPGRPHAPMPSPGLVRTAGEAGRTRQAPGLWPFEVIALPLSASAGLDVAMTLAATTSHEIHAGASVSTFAILAALALEIGAAGRVLPDLRHGPDGYAALWEPLMNGADDARMRAVVQALPPVCRALTAEGQAPETLVRHALSALVDAVSRDALSTGKAPIRLPRRDADSVPSALDSWLRALAAPSSIVDTEDGLLDDDLGELTQLVGEWRADAASRGASWRLCLRLREPAVKDDLEDEATAPAPATATAPKQGPPEDPPWELEFLLQATDDLSLLVHAEEVWRAGDQLQRASRSLSAPHEVFLAELGRAVRIYPALGDALRQPTPTGLALDLDGAHRFLTGAAPALEVAGFGVLLPAWWGRPSARLGVRLKTTTPSTSARRACAAAASRVPRCVEPCDANVAAAVGRPAQRAHQ